jgi:internalin A
MSKNLFKLLMGSLLCFSTWGAEIPINILEKKVNKLSFADIQNLWEYYKKEANIITKKDIEYKIITKLNKLIYLKELDKTYKREVTEIANKLDNITLQVRIAAFFYEKQDYGDFGILPMDLLKIVFSYYLENAHGIYREHRIDIARVINKSFNKLLLSMPCSLIIVPSEAMNIKKLVFDFPHTQRLTLLEHIPEDLIFLSALNNLTNFSLHVSEIDCLDFLSRSTNLRNLSFVDTDVSDITPLVLLTNLSDLNFSDTDVSDIKPLAFLNNLTKLNFRMIKISDIIPLVLLTNLSDLNFSVTDVSDITPLVSLNNLTKLDFSWTKVSNIAPLASLTNLSYLCFATTKISNLMPLLLLTNLTKLIFFNTNATDLRPLAKLTKLEIIDFSYTRVKNLAPLQKLPNLTKLDFTGTTIKSMEILKNLTNLKYLYFHKTKISDLRPIAQLFNLVEIGFSEKPDRDIIILHKLTNLRNLRLDDPLAQSDKMAQSLQYQLSKLEQSLPNLVINRCSGRQ